MSWDWFGVLMIVFAVAANWATAIIQHRAKKRLQETQWNLAHPNCGTVHMWVDDRLIKTDIITMHLKGPALHLECRARHRPQTLQIGEEISFRYDLHDTEDQHCGYWESITRNREVGTIFFVDNDTLSFEITVTGFGGKHCHRNKEVRRRPAPKSA